ncbi:MAG TPA: DNA polymerase III subunit beta [Planctomycetota bacterium]|nr:DNA polymerase III subunit beta [Planctomycetota bacterium]
MKFTGNRERLLEAFNVVGSVVSPRAIKPILQNLRMVVGPEGALLLATDLEVALRYRVPLDVVEEGGDVVIPVGRVQGILRESTADRIVFTSDDRNVQIVAGNGRFRIQGEDPEEFPVIPAFEDQKALAIPREAFRAMVRKTHFAAARERSRFAFNGVRLQVDGDEVRMIATDGKRMAVKMTPVDNPEKIAAGHIIPTKGLLTFEKVVTDDDPVVRVSVDDRQVMIKTQRAEVSSRLVEGAFPRYETVIPKETPLSASFPRETLLRAMRQAKLLTNEESRSVRLSFDDGKMVISARAMDVGDARVELETTVEGTPVETAFNPDFMIEGLSAMDGDKVVLRISGRDTPALLDGEKDYQYVVMPVTVRSA